MNSKSTYFNLARKFNSKNKNKIINFKGWSGLHITKFLMSKKSTFDNYEIDKKFPKLKGKEKIFIFTDKEIEFRFSNKVKKLSKFDSIDIITKKNFSFYSKEKNFFYMISSEKSKKFNNNIIYFNFLKDLKSRNLWGGQIISRPYEGKNLTLVLFDLKPGFKFEDKGHSNEQITWLIKGNMDFYSNSKKKKLCKDLGVSIGSKHLHGGTSKGAIGFDAFYPKRIEKKYRKN